MNQLRGAPKYTAFQSMSQVMTEPADPFEAVYFGGLNIPKQQRWKVIFRPGVYLYAPANNTPVNPGTGTFIINQDVLHIAANSDFMMTGVATYSVVNQAAPGIEPQLDALVAGPIVVFFSA